MTGKGHLFFSLACIIIAKKAALTNELANGDWWHIIPCTLFSSLLPDIDHPQALISQKVKWLAKRVSVTFGHRGMTHSIFMLAAFYALLFCIDYHNYPSFSPAIRQALLIGYSSHILADMLTPAGVPLLWPYRGRFTIPIIPRHKNNLFERMFCLSVMLWALLWQTNLGHRTLLFFN